MASDHDTPDLDGGALAALTRFEDARDMMLDALDAAHARILADLRQARHELKADCLEL
jgi:hypothetical protein